MKKELSFILAAALAAIAVSCSKPREITVPSSIECMYNVIASKDLLQCADIRVRYIDKTGLKEYSLDSTSWHDTVRIDLPTQFGFKVYCELKDTSTLIKSKDYVIRLVTSMDYAVSDNTGYEFNTGHKTSDAINALVSGADMSGFIDLFPVTEYSFNCDASGKVNDIDMIWE